MDDVSFDIAFRGYDTAQVKQLVDLVSHAIDSGEESLNVQAVTAVRGAAFDVRMRGYNRRQVEAYV